jgi:hypothetical protein
MRLSNRPYARTRNILSVGRWEGRNKNGRNKAVIQLTNNRKILTFWMTLRGITYTFDALRQRFSIHKDEKVKEEMRNFSAWRIAYRFKLFKNKIGNTHDIRIRKQINNYLWFGAQSMHSAKELIAKDIFLKVIRNYAEVAEIEDKFFTVSRHLRNIKLKMKRFLRLKNNRLIELRHLWDSTRNKLISDFLKAPREIKRELEKFAVVGSDTRDMMLDKYYSKKFNEFALKFIRWRFSIYESWSAEEYEGIFKRFELLKEQENALFAYNQIMFDALQLRKHDYIDYTLYDFSSMSIDIPGAPVRPRTPITNKHGRVIKQKEKEQQEEVDPKTVAVIEKDMPAYNYIPSIHELIMMYTKAVKIEQTARKRTSKRKKVEEKDEPQEIEK